MSAALWDLLALVGAFLMGYAYRSGQRRYIVTWIIVGTALAAIATEVFDLGRWTALLVLVPASVVTHWWTDKTVRAQATQVDRVLKLDGGRTVITFGRDVTPEQIQAFSDLMRRQGHS